VENNSIMMVSLVYAKHKQGILNLTMDFVPALKSRATILLKFK